MEEIKSPRSAGGGVFGSETARQIMHRRPIYRCYPEDAERQVFLQPGEHGLCLGCWVTFSPIMTMQPSLKVNSLPELVEDESGDIDHTAML